MGSCVVIEDSERVRDVVATMAEELGLQVLPAASAEQGATILQEHDVDVVLLDWDLPKLGALDVLTAVAEAQKLPRPHVILLATENEPQQFSLARAAGATHYLLKPFEKSDLADVLGKCGVAIDQAT